MEDSQSNHTWNGSQNESDQESQPPAYRFIYHLVILDKSQNHVLAEALPNQGAKLPVLELDTSIAYASTYESLEQSIQDELCVSVHIVREIANGPNSEIYRTSGIELNRIVLGDVLGDQPVVKRRLDWIHRSYASIATWGKTNADDDDSQVVTELNRVFEESKGEKSLTYPEPWRNPGW